MIEELFNEVKDEFSLLDELPTVYYTLITNTGLAIQGVIKQYFNQGIMTLEGTSNKTISLPVSRYDWISLDLDDGGYNGPLQIVHLNSVDEL
jgi:hypothetical protein